MKGEMRATNINCNKFDELLAVRGPMEAVNSLLGFVMKKGNLV